MADNPEARPEKVPAISISGTPHAPFIFYENAPAFGFTNGVVNVTLSANRTYAGPDGAIVNEQVVIAYLRRNVRALLQFETQALQDRLYGSHGVREASWISLSGCHPNRVQAKGALASVFLGAFLHESNEVRSEGIEKMKPVLENIETGNRPARI